MENRDKCRFVKLETTDDGLIATIEKMEFDADRIFIMDSNDKIFVFDLQGKFLNAVGRKGQGPNDHYSMYDFYLDRSRQRLCVFDLFKATIFYYSYSGKLLEKKKVNWNIFKDFSTITMMDSQTLLLRMSNTFDSPYNFRLVSGSSYETVKNVIPFLALGRISVSSPYSKVAVNSSSILVEAFLSDTLYRYDTNTGNLVPHIVFRDDRPALSPGDVKGAELEIALDALNIAREKNRSYGISGLAMTESYLHFTVQNKSGVKRIFWNMKTGRGSVSEIVNESAINNYFTYLIATTADAFVCAIPAEQIVAVNWDENESAKQAAENTLEDDNPVIAFYYLEQ
jgi:hypothetical protein